LLSVIGEAVLRRSAQHQQWHSRRSIACGGYRQKQISWKRRTFGGDH